MNATKQRQPFLTTFDDRLRDVLRKCKSLNPVDRQRLYTEINKICHIQIADCIDGFALANLIALHQLEGYGKKRIPQFVALSQKIIDEAVAKYDYATTQALRRQFKDETGIDFALNGEEE